MADRLLILGASARAAAASARRAGYEPVAIDLFADRDTKQICEAIRVPAEEYPEGLFRAARTMPKMPWMYTGGIENYPELVGELAKERELWGNGPEVLRQVRDPFLVSQRLQAKGIAVPSVRDAPSDSHGKWLRKPIASAGGKEIRHVMPDELEESEEGYVFQQYLEGDTMSAIFLGIQGTIVRVGLTKQICGARWLHSREFQYCGNVAPIPGVLGSGAQDVHLDVHLAGLQLASSEAVTGLFGIDFIHRDNRCYILEVNPRYTASVELLELSLLTDLLNGHRRSWSEALRPKRMLPTSLVTGKAIYYAPASFSFPGSGPWDDSVAHAADVWRRPDFADVPHPGEVIEAGHPVITILTEADTEDACLARLKARAAELDRLFGFPTPAETDP